MLRGGYEIRSEVTWEGAADNDIHRMSVKLQGSRHQGRKWGFQGTETLSAGNWIRLGQYLVASWVGRLLGSEGCLRQSIWWRHPKARGGT